MEQHGRFLITCEHGGNRIPIRYRDCFAGCEDLLQSHRGYDAGALSMARTLARQLGAPLIYSTISRLLVDLNRSPGHPRLHAEAIRRLPAELRQRILADYYLPFRSKVEAAIVAALASGPRVLHHYSHSFTPVLDGIVRSADVGLLYDPARAGEADLCEAWLACFREREPGLRLRRNYPYSGKSDGLTAYLRRRFPADDYLGIELEINQGIVAAGGKKWRCLRSQVIASLAQALEAAAWPTTQGRASAEE